MSTTTTTTTATTTATATATATTTATTTATATSLTDLPSDIIQTHILPRLDGPSLSATATVSSHLHTLCSDDSLWSHICSSTWPSTTHPRLHDVISGHRSFFKDSFPTLSAALNHRTRRPSSTPTTKPPHCLPCDPHTDTDTHQRLSEFISAVDVRYQNECVYSTAQFTHPTIDFLSSGMRIELQNDPTRNRFIDLEVDEIAGADKPTLLHLKESVTLSWIVIDPTRNRAGNLSSIKPVSVRQDWTSNETVIGFVTVLAGSDPDEVVQCKIQLVLGVGDGGVGLYVKEVVMKLHDLNSRCLSGREFLVIMAGALLEENNVRRKVLDDKERWRICKEFKEMKRERMEWEKSVEEKREFAIKMNYVVIFVSFYFSIYFLYLLLH